MGSAIFRNPPTSVEIREFLGRTIHAAGTAPRHLISDKGSQFWPIAGYKKWCRRRRIKPRCGAIGKHGSIAVIERTIKTLKQSLAQGRFVPLRHSVMRQFVDSFVAWHDEYRPHMTLNGKTPAEVYFQRFPANRRPRIEPRAQWPRGSPCALPNALVAGTSGARFDVEVEHLDGHVQLPIVSLCRAA
jgi:hypothetical protein